jgi:thioredoxin 1
MFMNKNTNLFERALSAPFSARLPFLLTSLAMFMAVAARGAEGNTEPDSPQNSSLPGQSAPGGIPASSASALKPSSSDSKPSKTDAQSLVGKGAGEVESTLGKPTGRLQTGQGALWLYADWRVQFDHQNLVLKVEKDQPVRLAKLDPQFVATADAADKAAVARAAADDAARIRANAPKPEKIRVVSNGGQQVDLPSLLTEGKITVVDFYADWCGPCRRLSPVLEQLAKDDANVVLLKIDIGNGNTPVTQQFGIQSIPSVRVFNRSKTQVGDATSDANEVMKHVTQAKQS